MPNHTPPQLFLIDGYALIYRAFFAMISRPLRTTKGENTSAAWGVVNFLIRLREKYRGNEQKIGAHAITSPVDHRFRKDPKRAA